MGACLQWEGLHLIKVNWGHPKEKQVGNLCNVNNGVFCVPSFFNLIEQLIDVYQSLSILEKHSTDHFPFGLSGLFQSGTPPNGSQEDFSS